MSMLIKLCLPFCGNNKDLACLRTKCCRDCLDVRKDEFQVGFSGRIVNRMMKCSSRILSSFLTD